jgi:chemotaxis protein MotB
MRRWRTENRRPRGGGARFGSLLFGAGGRENFVVLMTSLSMILLAFFILLYSIAVLDEQRRLAAMGSLLGSFGFMSGGFNLSVDEETGRQPLPPSLIDDNAAELNSRLQAFLVRRGIEDGPAVRGLADGTAVDFRSLFSPGGHEPTADGRQVLLELARLVRSDQRNRLTITGYGDSGGEMSLRQAALRAAAVYRFLVHHGGLNPSAMEMAGAAVPGVGQLTIEIRGGRLRAADEKRERYYRFRDFSVPLSR